MEESENRILIVDDQRVSRRILSAMVQKMGFETLEAIGSKEAKVLFSEQKICLILLDIELKNESGIEFCTWVRNHKNGSETPIIMATSHSEREIVLKAIDAGANDYIIKPFEQNVIEAKLKKFLEV